MKRAITTALFWLALLHALPARAEVVAFRGGTLHPVSGPPVEGVLVIDGDRIVAAGADVEVPAGARVVDVPGKHLYPGFIHAVSALGLVEIGSVPGSVDTSEIGDLNAALRAEVAFNADSMLLAPTMAGGVVAAHVVPQGGLLAGTSALMRLDGWTWEDMTLRSPVGMHVHFPRAVPRRGGPRPETPEKVKEELDNALETLSQALAGARTYRAAREATAAGKAPAPAHDPDLEALAPVVSGELPVYLHAEEKTQIEAALDWAEEQELANLVLVSQADAALVAERLARQEIPVVLLGTLRVPARSWEPYDHAYTAPTRLHAAGVRFALGDGGSSFAAANTRNLPFHAAMAAAFGLAREEALRSITLSAAEILGAADHLGSLEPGKEASFFVSDGDPLEIRTAIEEVWVAGRKIELEHRDRQRQLYQRYRERPRVGE